MHAATYDRAEAHHGFSAGGYLRLGSGRPPPLRVLLLLTRLTSLYNQMRLIIVKLQPRL